MEIPLGFSNEVARLIICEEIERPLGTTETLGKVIVVLGLGKILGELKMVIGVPPEYDIALGTIGILGKMMAVLGLEKTFGELIAVMGLPPEYVGCEMTSGPLEGLNTV